MDEYLYIIVGIAAVIFNIYKSANKKKKQQEAMAKAAQESANEESYQEVNYDEEPSKDVFQNENFPTDVMGEFEKIFGKTRNEPVREEYNVEELIVEEPIVIKEESAVINKEPVVAQENNYKIAKKRKSKNNLRTHTESQSNSRKHHINIKQAIIYNAILERKY